MSTPADQEALKDLSEYMLEAERVATLSDLDLIREAMDTEAGDLPVVKEIFNRFRPGWLEEL